MSILSLSTFLYKSVSEPLLPFQYFCSNFQDNSTLYFSRYPFYQFFAGDSIFCFSIPVSSVGAVDSIYNFIYLNESLINNIPISVFQKKHQFFSIIFHVLFPFEVDINHLVLLSLVLFISLIFQVSITVFRSPNRCLLFQSIIPYELSLLAILMHDNFSSLLR